jgi:Matrixin
MQTINRSLEYHGTSRTFQSSTVRALGVVLACLSGYGIACAQEVHLKARTITAGSIPANTSRRLREAGPVHQLLQFDHAPGTAEIEALQAAGIKVVAMVPDNALMVVASSRAIAAYAVNNGDQQWLGELASGDKLSSSLDRADGVPAIVEFHADVNATVQQSVAAAENVTFERPANLLANHAIVTTSFAKLQMLAEHDEVAYIFPADPALLSENNLLPCAGMLTLSGPIAQYANLVQGWDMTSDHVAHLGYAFGTLTTRLPAATVQSEILRALDAWASITNVTFSPAASAAAARTILVEFASGAHGDAYPFDAQGTVVAHTFYPAPGNPESIAGDMHLNTAENWYVGSGVDLYTVALHEAGHALGLTHTDNPGDVMYPYYQEGKTLSANDIGAVRALYGAPNATVSAPLTIAPATPPSSPAPAASPLTLELNAVTSPGQATAVSISGTVKGGTGTLSVQWQTDKGYSGKATMGTSGSWSVADVTLVAGANTLTVTAFDSAQHTATQSTVINTLAVAPAAAPISILITSPSSAVTTATGTTISLSGKASGGSGVTKITWQTSGGAAGTANGVSSWVAPGVPLLTGTNTIIVRAFVASGASAWASVVVVRE